MMDDIPHSRPWIAAEDEAAVQATLGSGMLAQGEATRRFEEAMARRMGGRDGIAVSCGTAAIELALRAIGVGAGDDVVLPTYVCRSVLDATHATGARPVLCDIGHGWVITPDTVDPKLSSRTKAIIAPHMYGLRADIPGLVALGVPIVEDCAQWIGPAARRPMESAALALSFHPTKCLTTGEGGMMIARDAPLLARGRSLRDGGSMPRSMFAPLSDIGGSLGLAQLERYDDFLRRRELIARRYLAALGDTVAARNAIESMSGGMFFRFPLRLRGGIERWQPRFLERGIHVRRGVDALLHRMLGLGDDAFPNAVQAFSTTVCIPLHPSLSDDEIRRCETALAEIVGPCMASPDT